jgi:hypothetical protein
MSIVSTSPDHDPDPIPKRAVVDVLEDYDPSANPFQLAKPNILGVPLQKKTVVIVDASSSSRDWLGILKIAIQTGTEFSMSGMSIQLVFLTADGVQAFPNEPTAFSDLSPSSMRQFMAEISPDGGEDLTPAFDTALTASPEHIIFVTGRDFTPERVQALSQQLQHSTDLKFDAIIVEAGRSGLEKITESHQGRCVTLTVEKLKEWYSSTL